MPRSPRGKGDPLTVVEREPGLTEVPGGEAFVFIRGVPDHSLEPQVGAYLLAGASVFLSIKWADPLQLFFGSSVRENRAPWTPGVFFSMFPSSGNGVVSALGGGF